jgi:glycosyltransferase involved in cell wall biosynthesis
LVLNAYSVVIPAYNAAAFIGETLDSVFAQTVPPSRVIVVDDGSPDATAETVLSYGRGVELVQQPNAGPGAATSRGIAMVDTPFMATLDADDLWLPNKLERQFSAFAAQPELAANFTRIANFRGGDPSSADLAGAYDGWLRPAMLVRTEIARAIGPIIDPPGAGDMVDWIARLREYGRPVTVLPEVLVLRRVHAGSMTAKGVQSLSQGYLQVARAAMLRRRAKDAGQ